MSFLKKLIAILNRPYPETESWIEYLRTIIFISLFVVFFLYVFEPFGLSTLESDKFLICLGFGSMTLLASIVYEFGLMRILRKLTKNTNFTFGKWILSTLCLVLAISFANFLYVRLFIFGYIKWEFLPQMIYGTFTIAIFPIVILGGMTLIRQEKRYQLISDEINEKKGNDVDIHENNNDLIFGIPASQIRYIEALQNYVRIGYVNSNRQLVEQTERVTLKRVSDDAKKTAIIKCHRSFLVNRNAIISTSGNAQGLLLSLSDCDKRIPVSRSYISDFRSK